jgi:hypothetical protein
MRLLNKKKIVILVVILGVFCGVGIYFVSQYQNTSARRPEDHYDGSIPQVHSSVDKDQDGVDDQTDILEGALSYVATKPKYKSKYYQTGYPDDQYGVCTDVVANAMKSAGYDLMELVQEDIAKNPDDYDIEEPDANIDFRRVKNLKVYFAHTAVSLTTDVSQIEEWQGGDIVIFKQHIGVVSDRRNENGVPYVIHHNGPKQTAYEQDILEKRDDLVAHYRVTE